MELGGGGPVLDLHDWTLAVATYEHHSNLSLRALAAFPEDTG